MSHSYMGVALGWTQSDRARRKTRILMKQAERLNRKAELIGSVVVPTIETNLGALDLDLARRLRDLRLNGVDSEIALSQLNASRPGHCATTELTSEAFDEKALTLLPHMPAAMLNALRDRQFCYCGELFVSLMPEQ